MHSPGSMQCIALCKWNRSVLITIANRFSFKIIGFTLPWLSIHEHLCRLSRVVKADLDGTIFAYDSIVGVGPKNGLQRVVWTVWYSMFLLYLIYNLKVIHSLMLKLLIIITHK